MQWTRTNVQWFLNPLTTWWSFIKSSTFQFVLGPSMPRWRNFPISKSLIALKTSFFILTAFGLWINHEPQYTDCARFFPPSQYQMFLSICHFCWWRFKLSSKETLNYDDALIFVCCFTFSPGQRPYTIIYLALSFFIWNCCTRTLEHLPENHGKRIAWPIRLMWLD